jgi:hypothetical protein
MQRTFVHRTLDRAGPHARERVKILPEARRSAPEPRACASHFSRCVSVLLFTGP